MKPYTNYHLAISKTDYQAGVTRGLYSEEAGILSYTIVMPTYKKLQSLLTRYGSKWGWDKRPKYYNNRIAIERRLKHEEARLFLFYKGKKEIGYCLVTAPEKFRAGSKSGNLHMIEIENIALDTKQTGNGYGRYFLQEMFASLFEVYETIYLSSRSTNHTGVIPFYQRMGMSVIQIERNIPSDLIVKERITA